LLPLCSFERRSSIDLRRRYGGSPLFEHTPLSNAMYKA
jgi:hypothetical protein